MGLFNWLFKKKNSTESIFLKLNECGDPGEEVNIVNSMVPWPKFFAQFDNMEDAENMHASIIYLHRKGTVTYIRPNLDGYRLFTGGKISNDEALQIFNTIRHHNSGQKGTMFYDWDPPL